MAESTAELRFAETLLQRARAGSLWGVEISGVMVLWGRSSSLAVLHT